MGQEIVYCFKCQKRILGSDYAKGLAFELENSSCCSACAVQVLDTLPPKAKEQLLTKMFKATQGHQPPPPSSKSVRKSTGRIPIVAAPPVHARPPADESSRSVAFGVLGAIVVVLVVAVFILVPSSPPPSTLPQRTEPAKPARPALPSARPEAGPTPQEKRRDDSAKEAMQKARVFAAAHPHDAEGEAREWKEALRLAEGTGYEVETRRELAKAETRAQDLSAQAIESLQRSVKGLADRKEFKAALDQLTRDQSLHAGPEWGGAVERLRDQVRASAAMAFEVEKEKAVGAKARGAEGIVAAARAEVARWGMPELVAELESALTQAWLPLFDGRSLAGFSSVMANAWKVEDGYLVQIPGIDNAALVPRKFGDGDVRFRFEARGVSKVWFAFRLEGSNRCMVSFENQTLGLVGEGEHELILSSRGESSSATLDGKSVPLRIEGQPKDGKIQFNAFGGMLRVKSIEYRPAG